MVGWAFVLILGSVLIGKLFLDFQNYKMEMMDKERLNAKEMKEHRKLMESIKKRIENLEAIAAGEPEEFKMSGGADMGEIKITDIEDEYKRENRDKVSDMAHKKRMKS